MQHSLDISAGVEPACGWWRDKVTDLLGAVRIADVKDAQAGALVGGEDIVGRDEAIGTVFPEVVRSELAPLSVIVLVGGDWDGGDRDRVRTGLGTS